MSNSIKQIPFPYIDIVHLPHLKVAQSDPGKASRFLETLLYGKLIQRLYSPHAEETTKERIQEVELTDDIRSIQNLHNQIEP